MVSSSSASIWDILAFGAVQGDVCRRNRLSFLDLGAISRHIACVSLGCRHKNIAFPWSGSIVFDGSDGNACFCIIVTVNGGRWLWVADFC